MTKIGLLTSLTFSGLGTLFGETSHVLTSQPHFEDCSKKLTSFQLSSFTFLTYFGKFFCLSYYLYYQQGVIDHLANSEITFKHSLKAKTQTRFVILFTSRSLSALGKSHRMSPPGI